MIPSPANGHFFNRSKISRHFLRFSTRFFISIRTHAEPLIVLVDGTVDSLKFLLIFARTSLAWFGHKNQYISSEVMALSNDDILE